jgi:WD40 repeat protein
MPDKEKAKGSPRQRYGLWLFFGLAIGISAAFLAFLGFFEPRRDMVFAETAQLPINQNSFFVGYSPDGQSIFTQSPDGHFHIWDSFSQDIAQVREYPAAFFDMQWNPEKTHFLAVDNQRAALLFDRTGNLVTAYEHPGVYMAYWNPQGSRIITTSETASQLWSVDGRLLREFLQATSYIEASLWSPAGSRFILWSNDMSGTIYDADGNEIAKIPLAGYPQSYAWNSTGSAFAMSQYLETSNSVKNRVVLYSAEGEELWVDELSPETPQVLWNSDGSRLAAVSYSPRPEAVLYSIEGERLAQFDTGNIFFWHPDGEILLTGTERGRDMRLMDKNGDLLKVLPHETDTRYTYPQWSPNGEILASWGGRPEENVFTLYLWDKDGNLLHEMSEGTPIEFLYWSPDSTRLLSAGGFVARIWSVDGGEINSLQHMQPIIHAQWSADSSRILTIGAYTSWVQYENAIWTNEGHHLATLFTGDFFQSYVQAWRNDFSQVLVQSGQKISVFNLQAGNVYFDFRFNN